MRLKARINISFRFHTFNAGRSSSETMASSTQSAAGEDLYARSYDARTPRVVVCHEYIIYYNMEV